MLFLKKTQTLTGSDISNILLSIITRIKPKFQLGQFIAFWIFFGLFFVKPALAITDPLTEPNNRVGIHIISATTNDASSAADLVNNNGDWGYITFLIESKDRNEQKWQAFFNDLRKRHLIPIVRLATEPDSGGFWKRPYDGEETAWADFLDKLVWPVKNRYITIYNEPNQAHEWGNQVDPVSYAQTLDKTITALKNKNADFFVLNAGLDASAPNKMPGYMDSDNFMKKMDETVPGIFKKLDGWVSHSYPNPGFVGSPDAEGKGTVRSWAYEEKALKDFGVERNLPVFITETGWKHSQGVNFDRNLPSPETIALNYKKAFENAWNDNRIVAVTPFILSYQEAPFDHFSFKKITGEPQNDKILGIQFPDYYPHYQTIRDLPKQKGRPVQENKAQFVKATITKQTLTTPLESSSSGELVSSLVLTEEYTINLTLKNTGQSIWNENHTVTLSAFDGGDKLSFLPVTIPIDKEIEPTQDYTFSFKINPQEGGKYLLVLNLTQNEKLFESNPVKFIFDVKSPVNLSVQATLKWKSNFSGDFILTIYDKVKSAINRSVKNVILSSNGQSDPLETRFLLPEKDYNFTLEKPFYKPVTIHRTVHSGQNYLDFGELQPDIASAVLHPQELWKLLPWSN